MTHRITVRDLRGLAATMNKEMDRPADPWARDPDTGNFQANIGNFHISGAYGGWALHEMVTEGGGVRDVFGSGHMPARELYSKMHAFRDGWYMAKRGAE